MNTDKKVRDRNCCGPHSSVFVCVHLWSIFCVLVVSGCGYSHPGEDPSGSYQWRSLYREDVKSVAVPIFTNKTYRRGVEFSLTKSLVNQIEAKSPYKVVPKERADTILEGQIVEIKLQNLSLDSTTAIPQ